MELTIEQEDRDGIDAVGVTITRDTEQVYVPCRDLAEARDFAQGLAELIRTTTAELATITDATR